MSTATVHTEDGLKDTESLFAPSDPTFRFSSNPTMKFLTMFIIFFFMTPTLAGKMGGGITRGGDSDLSRGASLQNQCRSFPHN